MDAKTMSERWQERSREISTQVAQWRVEHPTATLAEIEQAVDEQVSS
jgi:DNA-binding transcriptional regulator WhiA